MDPSLMGETAAILTSCLWTGSSLLFTKAGRRIGFFSLNAYRSAVAVGLLCTAHVILLGSILPTASSGQWLWMGFSGIVGLGIGDFGLFASYVLLGPRRAVLIMASSPIFASLGAYLVLGESFPLLSMIGIAVTLTGIIVVLADRREIQEKLSGDGEGRKRMLGVAAALVASIGQGFGVVLSKKGMYLGADAAMNPLSAALIRMMLATLFIWICAFLLQKQPELHDAAKNKQGMKYAVGGALIGPFVGMTLSMVAVSYAEAGIAQTLMSLMPVMIIPVIWVVYKERTNWRGILGAIIAVTGVAILFLT